ncbi:P-loop containing nucleoside triphosphate hydrolase protein [Dissoconium aciculare CBS 342.82]|uniref:P-loop containing nucleoside triphosphate hydrolase protein n=1 Tax=Dissoconium aciculare CBS 342.82 TaxID=1314786 RepID=A0A6J3M898_9PEZI|nr:P-loop containing nucleoside triphosphate hydrolase protein [Dissoconium aciculare CBS 342.82]KAF1823067.1 P-loop containing nucleoside triphosphate hydrolase protein [Dissoconium aciculare CBS 342.82]
MAATATTTVTGTAAEADGTFNQLPQGILEIMIPGYGPLARWVLVSLGIDISLWVSAAVILLATIKGAQYAWVYIERTFRQLFVSTIYIKEYDQIFDDVMAWLAKEKSASTKRLAQAKTDYGWFKAPDLSNDIAAAFDENGMFSDAQYSARRPAHFEPYYGRSWFWWNGRLFWFSRFPESADTRGTMYRPRDLLRLEVVGRDVAPIKRLLAMVKIWNLHKDVGFTSIRRPETKDRADQYGNRWGHSTSRPSRPIDTVILDNVEKARVIKDCNEFLHPASPPWYAARGLPYRRGFLFHGPPGTGKSSLSFALASLFGLGIYVLSLNEGTLTEGDLMQLFNSLPRRCIILLEDIDAAGLTRKDKPNAEKDKDGADKKKTKQKKAKTEKKKKEKERNDENEEGKNENGQMANGSEAGKDVVLTNGHQNGTSGTKIEMAKTKKPKAKKDKKKKSKAKKDEDFTLKDLAKQLKSLNGGKAEKSTSSSERSTSRVSTTGKNGEKKPTISLSGLLNAIDGVASHEGRILIMTTNHPEDLDPALIRPGRVDRKVEFRLAGPDQTRELFKRMYATRDAVPDIEVQVDGNKVRAVHKPLLGASVGQKKAPTIASAESTADREKDQELLISGDATLSVADEAALTVLAVQFAECIPEDTFTPAELQNHLMNHKSSPESAVQQAPEWVKKILKEKKQTEEKKKEDEKKAKDEDEDSSDDETDDSSEDEDDDDDDNGGVDDAAAVPKKVEGAADE